MIWTLLHDVADESLVSHMKRNCSALIYRWTEETMPALSENLMIESFQDPFLDYNDVPYVPLEDEEQRNKEQRTYYFKILSRQLPPTFFSSSIFNPDKCHFVFENLKLDKFFFMQEKVERFFGNVSSLRKLSCFVCKNHHLNTTNLPLMLQKELNKFH